MNSQVDQFLNKARHWRQETAKLRKILLDCGLTEELKWGKPCYTFQNKNVVIIQGFKDYCALLFFKGLLLKDPNKILKKTGENTHVGRQIRFTNIEEVNTHEAAIKAYVAEAVELEKSGAKVTAKEKKELQLPEEFQMISKQMPALKSAFEKLTPGRQRAYNIYFSSPKQSKTRTLRVEKSVQQILHGKGLNDR